MGSPGGPSARLRSLLVAAETDPSSADLDAIERAATAAFESLRRTDMRSGVANMLRRLAHLAANGRQPIEAEAWPTLRAAADLLERPGLTPADVRALDLELQQAGLDVDRQPPDASDPRAN